MVITKDLYKRILAVISAFILIVAGIFVCVPEHSYAASGVKMAQATNGEGGKTRGCKAGDQSGSEVTIDNWGYGKGASSPYHWKYVFRAKDPMLAREIANNMKAAAANNHVGYDKNSPDRYSFYDEAKKVNWNIANITTDCETTCASAISVCLNAAGVEVPRLWYSEIVYDDIMETGLFDCFTTSDYTASSANLLPGDILCNPDKHTSMVVESPNHFTFKVKYNDTKGKEDVSYVEETSSVKLNLNNGEKMCTVEVNGDVDLQNYEPDRANSAFIGWEKIDDNSYSAKYSDYTAPIQIQADDAEAIKKFE